MPKLWFHAALLIAALAFSPTASAQAPGGLSGQLDEAEKKLDADIKACRPIDVNDYFRLQSQATANANSAKKAQKAGLPVDTEQLARDSEHAARLLDRAQNAAAAKACPPPNTQPTKTAPPQTNPPPPPPPVQPTGGFLGPQIGTGEHDLLDELSDQADDAVDDYWDAYYRCDKEGMKRALDKLDDIGEQVHQIHETATAAGSFGRFTKKDIDRMMEFEDDIDDFLFHATFDVPKCPLLQQKIGRVGPSCPAPGSSLPQESLLRQPLKPQLGYIPRLSATRYSEQILDYHNSLRYDFGSPKLQWNWAMAYGSQAYAKIMADGGVLQHSSRTGRENERENLSLSPHRSNTIQTMLNGWGMERMNYTRGTFPNVSVNGDWMSVAHYTQMVWPTTTQIGCGFYAGKKYDALVCRYSPPGNRDGIPLIPANPCFPAPPPPPPPPPPPALPAPLP